jgi:hypothetical protein
MRAFLCSSHRILRAISSMPPLISLFILDLAIVSPPQRTTIAVMPLPLR